MPIKKKEKEKVVSEKHLSSLYKKMEKFQKSLDADEKALFVAAISSSKDGDSALVPAQAALIGQLRGLVAGTLVKAPSLSADVDEFWAQWAQRQY